MTNKRDVRLESVEMDEALNAEHCVDADSDIHDWADATDIEAAKKIKAAIDGQDLRSFLFLRVCGRSSFIASMELCRPILVNVLLLQPGMIRLCEAGI